MGAVSRHDPVFFRTVARFSGNRAHIAWALRPEFTAPGPYAFRLERARSGAPGADDWQPCSDSQSDVAVLSDLDDQGRRLGGFGAWQYRVVLSTPQSGQFRSNVISGAAGASDRHTRHARNIAYEWRGRGKRGRGDFVHGWVLKRKWRGVRPPDKPGLGTRHPITGAPLTGKSESARGAEFEGGYYAPFPMLVEQLSLTGTGGRRSPKGPDNVPARFFKGRTIDFPPIQEDDLFIGHDVDKRFYFASLEEQAHAGHIPLVVAFTARIAESTDAAYSVFIPDGTPVLK